MGDLERTIREAEEYIRSLFESNSDGHGFDHALRVYHLALVIAETEEGCDRQVVSLAALLHDADDDKLFATENNANARRFLRGQGLADEVTDRICETINMVSFRKNREKRPGTPEGRIVQDADRLDALGAVGIARTFAYGGAHGRAPECSIDHFHEKLLLLKDLMNTKKGKELAESRHAFMEAFLREWEAETVF
jgi:Predicted HD superfamily hydrolase